MDPENESRKAAEIYHHTLLTPGLVSWGHLSGNSGQLWLKWMVYFREMREPLRARLRQEMAGGGEGGLYQSAITGSE